MLYDVPVHMNRHPQLCEYVHSVLDGCKQWILDGELEKLAIVALSDQGRTVRTLFIEPGVDLSTIDANSPRSSARLPLNEIGEVLRAALVSIVAAPALVDIPESSDAPASFRLFAHTVEEADQSSITVNARDTANSWVFADKSWQSDSGRGSVVPVKMAQADDCPIKINVYMKT